MSDWWLASYLVLWILVLATLLVLLVVLRQLGLIYLRARSGAGALELDEGPPVGAPLRFDELDIDGEPVRFPDPAYSFNLLLMTTPWCAICKDALRGLSAVLNHYEMRAFVIDAGQPNESREMLELVDETAALVPSIQLQRRLGITTLPYGIVADQRGVVLSKGTVNNIDDLETLLERAEADIEAVPA